MRRHVTSAPSATTYNAVTERIIGAAIDVHRALGPGLLESSYEACLAWELVHRGHSIRRQKPVRLIYGGEDMGCGYRMDLVVDDTVVVELKAVEKLEGVHTATVLTYLRLSNYPIALLINFNVTMLRYGIRRLLR